MPLSLENLQRRKSTKPPRFAIYGVPGVGKTTLAAEFPNPVFIQTEDGPGDLELTTFADKPFTSIKEVEEAIEVLWTSDHDYKTVVLDSLDWMEPLVWAETCRRNNWSSIEDPGYGKGYVEADAVWRRLLQGFNALRDDKGMAVVFLAHEEIRTFEDPERASYDRYKMRLHKRAADMVTENADVVGFMNFVVAIEKEKAKFGKKEDGKAKASGSGQRMLHLAQRPAFMAKNRFGMPDSVVVTPGQTYATLAQYLPGGEPTETNSEKAA